MSNYGSVKKTLFRSYIIYTLITITLFILCLTGGSYVYLNSKEQGLRKVTEKYDDMIYRESYEEFVNIDIAELEKVNGWIQIIDEDYRTVVALGKNVQKKNYDSIYEVYTTKNELDGQYRCKMKQTTDKYGNNYIVLIVFDKQKHLDAFAEEVLFSFFKALGVSVGGFLILFFLNIYIFSRWVADRITNPLDVLTNKLRNVPKNNEQQKIQYTDSVEAEFVEIADSFNYMIDEIIRTEEMKKEAEDDKKKMIVDISHDIKTPITTIQGYARAMSDGIVKDEKEKEQYLNTICMKAQSVTELINLLFEYVKLDHRSYQLNVENRDVTELARQIIAEFYGEIIDKKFELDINIPEDKIMADIDYMQMKRVITNIITNSLKYNTEGTKIIVNVFERKGNAVLIVGDNGVGIPKEIMGSVFDPFVRGEKDKASKVSGSGIGLSIVKKIIDLHNGTISLMDEGNDIRSKFEIVIPKERIKVD